jgi:predicted transposase YdaD
MLANQQSIKELEGDGMSYAAMARMFEEMGFHQEWEERGFDNGRKEGITIGKEQGITLGKQQGITLGLQQGIHGALRVFQGLKNREPLEQLAEETGLPVAEIEKIQLEFTGGSCS